MNLDLNQILSDAEEYAAKRDATTPGNWASTLDCRYVYAHFESFKKTAAETLIKQQLIADTNNYQISKNETKSNCTFIAAAKNYDSPAVIRQLVERIKELENKLSFYLTKPI